MLARVTTSQGKPEQIEAGIRKFKEEVGSVVKEMTGFKGSYLLVERKSGKMLGIALWDNKENLEASSKVAAQIRKGVVQAAGSTELPTVEIFEVAVRE